MSSKAGLETKRHGLLPASLPLLADWIIYAGMGCASMISALFGAYRIDPDTVAYLDISDAIRSHNWQFAFNAIWFPFYPFLLTIARAVFGYRVQYELMAARLLDAVLNLAFVGAAIVLAAAVRRVLLDQSVSAHALLPARTLYLWVALVAYFLGSLDLLSPKPDTLVSILMILCVAALFRALSTGTLTCWLAVGVCGGLAFWAKAFALPFFLLLILFTALVHLRKLRILAHLTLALAVFAFIVAPLAWKLSVLRGRLTFGDTGRLNVAWHVNHADRFNALADPTEWQPGLAIANFKHPGELLSKTPLISYYGGSHSFGSIPLLTDLSYWYDGLIPRFVPRQSLAALKFNLSNLASMLVMRFQIVLLGVLLGLFGFRLRRGSFATPIVFVPFALAITSIGLYAAVHIEPRYITFAFVIIASAYAASALTRMPEGIDRSLHAGVLISAALVLVFLAQASIHEGTEAREQGARPLQGIYNQEIDSAGAQLASLYPRGAEVACMGKAACWTDPYWVRYAGLRMTALVDSGRGAEQESAEQECGKLAQNPAALDALRGKNVRAIVARFEGEQPCSAAWQPLGSSPNFFYLPL